MSSATAEARPANETRQTLRLNRNSPTFKVTLRAGDDLYMERWVIVMEESLVGEVLAAISQQVTDLTDPLVSSGSIHVAVDGKKVLAATFKTINSYGEWDEILVEVDDGSGQKDIDNVDIEFHGRPDDFVKLPPPPEGVPF